MGRKKTRALIRRGFFPIQSRSSLVALRCRLLGCRVGAGCLMHPRCPLILLADLLHQATRDQVLKLFISTQTKHFLASANGIAYFEVCKNALEKIIEAEYLFLRKDIAKLVCNVVWKAT